MDFLSSHPGYPSATSDGSKETSSGIGARSPGKDSRDSISNALSELKSLKPSRPSPCEQNTSSSYAAAVVGDSEAMQRLRSQVKRIAPYFRTALITGSPGTGKEGVARMLHSLSPCVGGEFIAHEASALAETITRDQAGSVLDTITATSIGGTLFLNEVGETPLPLQGALLRLWTANGRGKMRVVAGTHRDLRTMGVTGQFRQDLAQRLIGIELAVPALSERRADLPAVIHEVLRCADSERRLQLSSDAMARMLNHHWVGDVAEVDQVIRAAASAAGRRALIEAGNLPELRVEEPEADQTVKLEKLEDVVRQHVLGVLTRCGGNKLRTAEILGISRSTLYRMLETCVGEGTIAY